MVADIFYPILTLKITVLACFIQKKIGASPPTEHHPGLPGGLTALPIPPATKKKRCAHIFSGLSPALPPRSGSSLETVRPYT